MDEELINNAILNDGIRKFMNTSYYLNKEKYYSITQIGRSSCQGYQADIISYAKRFMYNYLVAHLLNARDITKLAGSVL